MSKAHWKTELQELIDESNFHEIEAFMEWTIERAVNEALKKTNKKISNFSKPKELSQ